MQRSLRFYVRYVTLLDSWCPHISLCKVLIPCCERQGCVLQTDRYGGIIDRLIKNYHVQSSPLHF